MQCNLVLQNAAQAQQLQSVDPRLQSQQGSAAAADPPASSASQPVQTPLQDPRLQNSGIPDPRLAESHSGLPDPRLQEPRLQDPRLQDPRLQAQPTYPQQLVNEAAQQSQQQSSYPQRVLSHAATSPNSSLENPATSYPVGCFSSTLCPIRIGSMLVACLEAAVHVHFMIACSLCT